MIHIPTVDGPSPLAAEIDDMARWYIAVATETPIEDVQIRRVG
jgi:hypothetical protein